MAPGGRHGRVCGNIAQDCRASSYGKQTPGYGKIHHGSRLADSFPACITPNPSTPFVGTGRQMNCRRMHPKKRALPSVPPPERLFCRKQALPAPHGNQNREAEGTYFPPLPHFLLRLCGVYAKVAPICPVRGFQQYFTLFNRKASTSCIWRTASSHRR